MIDPAAALAAAREAHAGTRRPRRGGLPAPLLRLRARPRRPRPPTASRCSATASPPPSPRPARLLVALAAVLWFRPRRPAPRRPGDARRQPRIECPGGAEEHPRPRILRRRRLRGPGARRRARRVRGRHGPRRGGGGDRGAARRPAAGAGRRGARRGRDRRRRAAPGEEQRHGGADHPGAGRAAGAARVHLHRTRWPAGGRTPARSPYRCTRRCRRWRTSGPTRC